MGRYAPQWWLIGAAVAVMLAVVWILTYRALGSEHPWRANRFKFGYMRAGA